MAPDEDEERPRSPYRTMREIATDDRPRERLLHHGPEVLSDGELVALILGSGMRGENVIDLARSLLETIGGLPGLVRAEAKTLQRARGLGPAKAAQLAAAIELGRRVQQIDPDSRPKLVTPDQVFQLLGARLLGRAKEELYVLALDTRSRLLGAANPIHGGVNHVPMHTADVFREAIVLEAVSIILVHNHPSGDPRPSAQDVAATKAVIAAGVLLGIEVMDHVIIGQGRFVSMQREGYAFPPARR
ncbi:MAG: DNA repair protein RadC [Dehalococcoidia bacterium]